MAITGRDGMNMARRNVTGDKREGGTFASSMDASSYAAAVGLSGGIQNSAPPVKASANNPIPSGGAGTNNSTPILTNPWTSNEIIDLSGDTGEDALIAATMMDAQQQQMNRWKILQDTQIKIYEIQQDVTIDKAKSQDNMFAKWDDYIRR